ncbi:unnamed protein product [Agarophyton chilense]
MSDQPFPPDSPRSKTLARLLVSAFFITAILTATLHLITHAPFPARVPSDQRSTTTPPNVQQVLTNDTLLRQISSSQNFAYFPSADLLLASVAKAGSTSLFHWLFRGVVGGAAFTRLRCDTHVQDLRSVCWKGRARYLSNFTMEERRRILTSPATLRMAVQRNPFDRLISSFNDKFACATEELKSGHQYNYIVPLMRELAGLPSSPVHCMNVSEFALALDNIRVKRPIPLQQLDVHVRPQWLYLEHIPYDLVLDVGELSNKALIQGVMKRLPFRELVADGVPHHHAIRRTELMIPETAAKRLHRFAMESQMAHVRYLSSSSGHSQPPSSYLSRLGRG